MRMPFNEGLNLILIAFKGDLKDRCFQMFVMERLFMTDPISFEDYCKNMTGKTEKVSKDEVYAKVNNILKNMLKEGGESNGSI